MTLLKDATNREALEKARQRNDQSPRDFHLYLDFLEKQFPRASEKQRALSCYAKLQFELRQHIYLHSTAIPDTREVVKLATRFWDSMTSLKKRKFSGLSEHSEFHSKAQKENSKDSSSSQYRRTPGSTRKSENMKKRANSTQEGTMGKDCIFHLRNRCEKYKKDRNGTDMNKWNKDKSAKAQQASKKLDKDEGKASESA